MVAGDLPEVKGQRRQLGTELARLRDQAGVSGRDLALRIGISQSKVSRIETGTAVPSLSEVDAWAEAVQASADIRERLLALTQAAFTEVHTWRAALRARAHLQDKVHDLESQAKTVRTYQPSVIPGLLQTADYARRVFAMFEPPYTDQNLAVALAARLDRQLVLFEEGRRFEFLITEAALRWSPGPARLQLAQLDRIKSLSTLDGVSIGLVPHRGVAMTPYQHGFIIYTGQHDAESMVVVETIHARISVHDPEDISLYENAWARLHQMALFDQASCAFLAKLDAEFRPTN